MSLHTLVWRSPAFALEWAAEGVKHDRIEFGVYRNLLRAALAQQEASAHEIAFRSIRDVLQYGGAFADDLKAELKGLAPQVFITTTTSQAGKDAGAALEKELRNVGMTVVSVDRSDQAQIGGTKVSCYGAETCKDAKGLVALLRGKGYDVVEADTSSRSEDNSDDMASALYGAKVIRVALTDPTADADSHRDAARVRFEATPGEIGSPERETPCPARRTGKKPVLMANW